MILSPSSRLTSLEKCGDGAVRGQSTIEFQRLEVEKMEDDDLDLDLGFIHVPEQEKQLSPVAAEKVPIARSPPIRKIKTTLGVATDVSIIVGLVCLTVWLIFVNENLTTTFPWWSTKSKSADYALNFPQVFPSLDGSTQECKAAWRTLTTVPCHTRTCARNWDSGIADEGGAQIKDVLPFICHDDCGTALIEAQALLQKS